MFLGASSKLGEYGGEFEERELGKQERGRKIWGAEGKRGSEKKRGFFFLVIYIYIHSQLLSGLGIAFNSFATSPLPPPTSFPALHNLHPEQ